eukprot:jgi/Galph1/3618/GphlegSOOS_G2300.1
MEKTRDKIVLSDKEEPQVSLLVSCSDYNWTQLWCLGDAKPRRSFSTDKIGPGSLAVCRLFNQTHFVCKKDSKLEKPNDSVPGSFQFFSLYEESMQYKCSAPEGLKILRFTSSGRYLIGGDASGRIYVWETSTGLLLDVFDAHWRSLSDLCFETTETIFVSASDDGTIKSWSLLEITSLSRLSNKVKPEPLCIYRGHTMPVSGIGCGSGPVEDLLVSCSLDCTVRVWSLVTGEMLQLYSLPCPLTCLAFNIEDAVIFIGSNDGRIFQLKTVSTLAKHLEPVTLLHSYHQDRVTCLRWIPFQHILISASEDKNICLFQLPKGELLQMYNKCLGKVSNIEVLYDDCLTDRMQEEKKRRKWNISLRRVPLLLESKSEQKALQTCYEPTVHSVRGLWDHDEGHCSYESMSEKFLDVVNGLVAGQLDDAYYVQELLNTYHTSHEWKNEETASILTREETMLPSKEQFIVDYKEEYDKAMKALEEIRKEWALRWFADSAK